MNPIVKILTTLRDSLDNIEEANKLVNMSPFIYGSPVVDLTLDKNFISERDTDSMFVLLEYELKMSTWVDEACVQTAACVNDSSFTFIASQPLGNGFVAGLIYPEKMETSRILGAEVIGEDDEVRVPVYLRSRFGEQKESSVDRIIQESIPMLNSIEVLEKIMASKN